MLKEPDGMEDCSFFTRRVLSDGSKVTAWIPKESESVNILYVCGSCNKKGELVQEYVKPITFSCGSCGEKIVVEPIRGKKRGKKKK